jgi:hypothetical protein
MIFYIVHAFCIVHLCNIVETEEIRIKSEVNVYFFFLNGITRKRRKSNVFVFLYQDKSLVLRLITTDRVWC